MPVKLIWNDDIIEAKVRKRVVQKIVLYLIQHYPNYNNFVLNLPYLNDIPEHGIINYVIIFYDKANSDGLANLPNTGNEYSVGNSNSIVPMPHVWELENDAIEAQLEQMQRSGKNMSQPRLNWPTIGSHPIDDFNNKGLAIICFT